MAPGFDIAEAGPDAVFGEGNDRLAFAHLLLDIVGAAFGDAGSARHGRGLHFVANDLCEVLVGSSAISILKCCSIVCGLMMKTPFNTGKLNTGGRTGR